MKIFSRPMLIAGSIFTLLVLLVSCTDNESKTNLLDDELDKLLAAAAPAGKGREFFIMPNSDDLPNIPQDDKNPLNIYKVALGQLLFHETALGRAPKISSSYQTYSCASCHHARAGFQACLAQGIGEGGVGFGINGEARQINTTYPLDSIDVQPIRSPSAMNGAWQQVMLWNGQFGAVGPNTGTEAGWTAGTPKFNNHLGFEGLETQAIAGQTVHRLLISADWVKSIPRYKELFDQAFPEVAEADRYTRITAGEAIAAYERTLMSNLAPWQRYLKGVTGAMSDEEKEGAILFLGKGGCVDCHTGPALNSMAFYGLGMGDLQNGNYGAINVTESKAEHKGRGGFTGKAEDMFKFKVPQLYNLKDSPFYGHGATFTTIREVVAYKNTGVSQNPNVPATQISPLFKPLNLTEEEVDKLALFLEKSLYDGHLNRYVPTHLPSDFCFPNNDTQSRIDNGCE